MKALNTGLALKNLQFSTNISKYLGNGANGATVITHSFSSK